MLALCLLSGSVSAQDEKKPMAPKPEAEAPKEEMKKPQPQPVISIQKSSKPDPCIIKPVMSDKELRDCGAKIK
jgi:hypothetical protein